MYYVALDIGCIECGEPTEVLGIFTDEKIAEKVCEKNEKRQEAHWRGQHNFGVWKISELDKEYEVDY